MQADGYVRAASKGDSGFTRALTIFVIGVGVGLGLCGLGAVASAAHSGDAASSAPIAGAGLLFLSRGGLAITTKFWAALKIYDAVRR